MPARIYFKDADFPYASTVALLTLILLIVAVEPLHQALQGAVLMRASLATRPAARRRRDRRRGSVHVSAVLVGADLDQADARRSSTRTGWSSSTSCRPAINYAVTLLGKSRSEAATAAGDTFGVGGASSYDSRQTIIDSAVVAVGSTALTLLLAVLAAYALSRCSFRGRQGYPRLDPVAALHAADRHHRADRLHVPLSRPARHAGSASS